MAKRIRIGTRDSQLALWQANEVKGLLEGRGHETELVYIKSEGDIDLVTPLYELGVQGVFTRALDAALLSGKIDIAVHSMKDVPTQLAKGIAQAAVLPRASYKDILVYKGDWLDVAERLYASPKNKMPFTVATSSIRRRAQWLNRYPHHSIDNLRGNVNTRLQKLSDSNWQGAIFAAAGLERINLRPDNSIELDWMLPAPAQGAIMVVARDDDHESLIACVSFNDIETALCAKVERDFLRTLLGGCSTPISALAVVEGDSVVFNGNIVMPDGSKMLDISKAVKADQAATLGVDAANELLRSGGNEIVDHIRNAG